MLYVFQVDTGTMLTFDMTMALENITKLKDAISISSRIPLDRLVLLVNGGSSLDMYSAVMQCGGIGTDTNPIFLFNRNNIDSSSPTNSGQQPLGSNENLAEIDSIKHQVESSLALPPTYQTVKSRAILSNQLYEMAKELSERCTQSIYEQHLQHQGWCAVVANLEDFLSGLKTRIAAFSGSFVSYQESEDERNQILAKFADEIDVLSKIPLIPNVISENGRPLNSLLDWITYHSNCSDLNSLVPSCKQSASKLDISTIDKLKVEINFVVDKSSGLVAIIGLEERLAGLDVLKEDINRVVQEQYDLAVAFAQNQKRASALQDISILPDLCQTHQQQLLVMAKNHEFLEGVRRRVRKSKEELTSNVNGRLKWVMDVQRLLYESSIGLAGFMESLKRTRCQIDFIKQVLIAKDVYCEAVVEVYRRRRFTDSYTAWADKMHLVYRNEFSHRQAFESQYNSSFVLKLFPGLRDIMPTFGNGKAATDTELPMITDEDIEKLRVIFPSIFIPKVHELPDFTVGNSNSSLPVESESLLALENENLKAELEKLKLEISARNEELQKVESSQNLQIESLKEELNEVQGDLACAKRLQAQTEEGHEEYIVDLQGELCQTKERLLVAEQLLATATKNIDAERAAWTADKDRLREDYDKTLNELEERLVQEKESEVRQVKEKARGDFEGLRSRYRFMQTVEQKSPTENFDKALDSFERLALKEDLTGDLFKTIKKIRKNHPDGISPKLLRKIISKLSSENSIESSDEGSSLIRTRNISESDGMKGFDADESVYGLDNSSVEPTSPTSFKNDAICKDFANKIVPTERIVSVYTKLLQSGRVSAANRHGDFVFVYWNNILQTYVIHLKARILRLLHPDSVKLINQESSSKIECLIARFASSEFCVARKFPNRYHVPLGFHFHRVHVQDVEKLNIDFFLS